MRVLITGSEGFTGRYVCDEFSKANWEVWRAGLSDQPGSSRYLKINLLEPSSLIAINQVVRPEVVVHLAAEAFVGEGNPDIFYQVNLLGTRHLLDALCQAVEPPKCTILASSANVYGNSNIGLLSEIDPVNPANDYAVSKLAMEYLARTYMDKLGIIIVRPFNYTGVGQSERFLIPKIVAHFRKKSPIIELGNLDIARDFSDVRDIAAYYRGLAEQRPINETMNFCSGTAVSLEDCLSIAQEITGHDIEIKVNPDFVRENEVKFLRGDRSRLEGLIDIRAPRPIHTTLSWMLSS